MFGSEKTTAASTISIQTTVHTGSLERQIHLSIMLFTKIFILLFWCIYKSDIYFLIWLFKINGNTVMSLDTYPFLFAFSSESIFRSTTRRSSCTIPCHHLGSCLLHHSWDGEPAVHLSSWSNAILSGMNVQYIVPRHFPGYLLRNIQHTNSHIPVICLEYGTRSYCKLLIFLVTISEISSLSAVTFVVIISEHHNIRNI